jgi:hypothetical protein
MENNIVQRTVLVLKNRDNGTSIHFQPSVALRGQELLTQEQLEEVSEILLLLRNKCKSFELNAEINIYERKVPMETESFLISNGFYLESRSPSQKTYRKTITDRQTLKVVISTNGKIIDVCYENDGISDYYDFSICLETIQTVEQLDYLLMALSLKNN